MLDRITNTTREILTVRKRLPLVDGQIGEIINYIRVSPQIHLLNIGMATLSTGLFFSSDSEIIRAPAVGIMGGYFYNLAKAILNLDTYYRLRHNFERTGFDPKFLRTKTLCSRNASRLAAIDAGYEEEVNEYYQKYNLDRPFI